jgi:hypothetical protein
LGCSRQAYGGRLTRPAAASFDVSLWSNVAGLSLGPMKCARFREAQMQTSRWLERHFWSLLAAHTALSLCYYAGLLLM